MIDFILSALPFVIIGICVAVLAVKISKTQGKEEKNALSTKMALGMCFGMCGGVALSTMFDFNFALGISLGMLIGETVGMFVKTSK